MTTPEAPHDPTRLLRLKDEIQTRFDELPPEHQASMGLVILSEVMNGEWGSWLKDAILLKYGKKSPSPAVLSIPPIEREDLRGLQFDENELSQLSDADLMTITHRVEQHLSQDVLPDEIQFAAEQLLEEKHGSGTENP